MNFKRILLKLLKMSCKYIIQPNSYTCGPIAIINAQIWKDGYSNLDIKELSLLCNLNEERGVERWDLDVNILGISQKPTYSISTIRKKVDNGDSAIILISFRENGIIKEHYIFLEKRKYYTIHNYSYSRDHVSYKSWEELFDDILRSNPNDKLGLFYPCAWIISKKLKSKFDL